MKNLKIFIASILFMLVTATMFAQVKVIGSGNSKIGVEGSSNNNDPTGLIRLQILGNADNNSGDCCRPGAKLAFGDFGTPTPNGGAHAFIGEWGTYDSDELWLHGRRGIHITSGGSATFEGALFKEYGGLNVEGEVKSWGTTLTSDIRLKKNVQAMNSALCLSNILKLKAISYDLKMDKEDLALAALNQMQPKEDKEKKGIADFRKSLEKKKVDFMNQIGFSAQDIKPILPQLVKEGEDGFLAVNYVGLIPVLVESIKEQQAIIDAQRAIIDAQQKDIIAIKLKLGMR